MACHEIQSWTFSGLVGAFLDLAIVFFLLCASTLTFVVSKLLGLFGSSLPCHCNGNFGPPKSEKCWQRVLVNRPSERISSVQFSVRSKLPFDSILEQNLNPQSNINPLNENKQELECFGLDAEASSTLFKEMSEMGSDGKEENFDLKGKEVSSKKRKHSLRRRRKVSTDIQRFSSISSYGSVQLDFEAFTPSPASDNIIKECRSIPDSFGDATLQNGRYSSVDMDLVSRESRGLESNESMDEYKRTTKDELPADDWKFDAQRELSCGSDERSAIRVLEQALEEEHTARDALCNELEKERSAAASAADEAMAMILRLQEEKASIEMEARQYQRMMEEKAAYDFEEMNILKEILLRREREKHFLEKEVETLRLIIFRNEQLDADAKDMGTSLTKRASLLVYSGEDLVPMLKNISKSFNESGMEQNANKISEYGAPSIDLQDCEVSFGKELSISEFDKVGSLKQEYSPTDSNINKCNQQLPAGGAEMNVDLEKMKLLPSAKGPFPLEREMENVEMDSEFKSLAADRYNLHEQTFACVEEVQQQNDVIIKSHGLASTSLRTCYDSQNKFQYTDSDLEKKDKDENGMFNLDPHPQDVQTIGDKSYLGREGGENESIKLSENVSLSIPRRCDDTELNRSQIEQAISRSCSDITIGLPPLVCSQEKSLLSDFRRNSMSAVDYERFKIDNEIGWLRERLRIVQEGRERLKTSIEHGEKDKVQLQLLENIVNQLQEIRKFTETRTVRQVSLPPSSRKVLSKKRRWRSFSLEVNGRT